MVQSKESIRPNELLSVNKRNISQGLLSSKGTNNMQESMALVVLRQFTVQRLEKCRLVNEREGTKGMNVVEIFIN